MIRLLAQGRHYNKGLSNIR